jgi:transketolase
VAKGAYVLADPATGKPQLIFMATGSEVGLAVDVHERLAAEGIATRVVSMPSWELFLNQPQEYQDQVLPPEITKRISVEQASTFGWHRFLGSEGKAVGMQSFGASAPLKELLKKFGFTPDALVAEAKKMLGK